MKNHKLKRRTFLASLAATPLSLAAQKNVVKPAENTRKIIPSSGEPIPVIGMGTWLTFDVGTDAYLLRKRTEVLKTFFEKGGAMVDSSPMYGSSEKVIGHSLGALESMNAALFSATKVWTPTSGKHQINQSFNLWGLDKIDLYQVHNLVNWREHLAYLKELKQEGRIRYIGITTSHGRKHSEFEKILTSNDIDFAQLTYNIIDREAEKRLLPAALDNGIAVIANRPFQGGRLFRKFGDKPLPIVAKECGCQNWAQLFLQFIVSHPAITCAIPATTKVDHMNENMGALYGSILTQHQRHNLLKEIDNVLT